MMLRRHAPADSPHKARSSARPSMTRMATRARRALRTLFLQREPLSGDVGLVASEFGSQVIRHTDDGGHMEAWNDADEPVVDASESSRRRRAGR